MPLKWIKPEVFMRYKGVKVYYTYPDDMLEISSEYWFSFDGSEGETGDYEHFDVRNIALDCGIVPFDRCNPNDKKRAIRKALDEGRLLYCMPSIVAKEYYEKYGPFSHTLGPIPGGDRNV